MQSSHLDNIYLWDYTGLCKSKCPSQHSLQAEHWLITLTEGIWPGKGRASLVSELKLQSIPEGQEDRH